MNRILAPVFFALFSLPLFAQVEVVASLEFSTYLLYEGMPLRVQITNRGSEPLQVGGRTPDALLRLRVNDTRNRVIPRTETALLPEAWVIAPGATETRSFDLVQLFKLRAADSFRCLVDVELEDETLSSKPLMFDISTGTLHETIRRRRNDRVFTLLGINRNGRDELLLRVSSFNEDTHFATYFLERHLRFFPPQMLADDKGRIAIFHYESPQRGVLCRFEADGTPVGREFYRISPGSPAKLMPHPELGLAVAGAERIDP
jgi:hypothetical protein